MIDKNKIKEKTIILTLFYFILIFLWFLLSNGSPFLALYENGFDKLLNVIIKSETKSRVRGLIVDLDKDFFKIMIAFLFFIIMCLLLINSKKLFFLINFTIFLRQMNLIQRYLIMIFIY